MAHSIINFCDKTIFVSFCLLVALLPFSSGAIQFLLFFIVLVFLIRIAVKRPKMEFRWDSVSMALVTWLAFCIISILVNPYPEEGWKQLFLRVLPAVGLFYAFVETMKDEARIRWFLASAALGVLVVCLAGLWQYVFGEDFLRHRPLFDGRVQSTMKSPTDFAGYLVAFAPFLLILGWERQESGALKFFGLSPRHSQIFLLMTFLLSICCLALTYSRGGWLAFSLIVLALAVWKKYLRWPVVIFLIAFWIYVPQKMIHERRLMDATLVMDSFGRKTFWTEAWHLIQHNWMFGVGLNAYRDAVQPYKITWGEDPHNCYLHMWAEIGIFGLLAFLAAQIMIFVGAIRAFLREQDAFRKNCIGALALGYAGFLFHSAFDTFFYSASLGILFWLMMGLIVVLSAPAKTSA